MCTVPIEAVLEAQWDSGTSAMEAQILRPLRWLDCLTTGKKTFKGAGLGLHAAIERPLCLIGSFRSTSRSKRLAVYVTDDALERACA
jgi:hypothetical protein